MSIDKSYFFTFCALLRTYELHMSEYKIHLKEIPSLKRNSCKNFTRYTVKVHVFLEGNKNGRNLHRRFNTYYIMSNRQ